MLSDILGKRSPVINVLDPESSAGDALRVMSERQVGAVLVVEEGRLVGIFSERDLVRRVLGRGLSADATSLRLVMTPAPVTASPDDRPGSAILKMKQVGCRHLPIVHDWHVVDMISIRDLLFAEIREREGEIEELRRYIQGS